MLKKLGLVLLGLFVMTLMACLAYKFSDEKLNPEIPGFLVVAQADRDQWLQHLNVVKTFAKFDFDASKDFRCNEDQSKAEVQKFLVTWLEYNQKNPELVSAIDKIRALDGFQYSLDSLPDSLGGINNHRNFSKYVYFQVCFLKNTNRVSDSINMTILYLEHSIKTVLKKQSRLSTLLELNSMKNFFNQLSAQTKFMNQAQKKQFAALVDEAVQIQLDALLLNVDVSESKLQMREVLQLVDINNESNKTIWPPGRFMLWLIQKNNVLNTLYNTKRTAAEWEKLADVQFKWFGPQNFKHAIYIMLKVRHEDSDNRIETSHAKLMTTLNSIVL